MYSVAMLYRVSLLCMVYVISLFARLTSGCPTWYSNTTGYCECGWTMGIKIICHQDAETVDVRVGYCMTFDYDTQSVLAGACSYGYTTNMTNRMYSLLPKDPTQLNETTCGPYNREGVLCEHCIKGFGPSAYSTDLHCVNCTDLSTGYAIILYITLEFVPVTLFFFICVILHVNITSGPMLGYILYCQAWTSIVQWNVSLWHSVLLYLPSCLVTLAHVSITLADVWNLHFFKYVLPSFCLSERMSDIHLHMLSFVTAVYPVLLMATTCIAIELYANNYRIIQFLGKPFHMCFVKCQKTLKASDSVVHAFATFIMLSTYTLTYDVITLFSNTVVHPANGTVFRNCLLYDPSIVMYSTEHIVYVVVAMMLWFLLSMIPAFLLCLYPTRAYEKISRCCRPRKRLAAKAFAEAIHSCFKDGLNGTTDFRACAGLIVMTPFLFALVQLPIVQYVPRLIVPILYGISSFFLSLFLSYLRPCKSLIMNLSLSFHAMLFGTLFITAGLWSEGFSFSTEILAVTFISVIATPHILIFIWTFYKFVLVHCVNSCHKCHLKTVMAVLRTAALPLHKRRDYEELNY